MIYLRASEFPPKYMTTHSAAADLFAAAPCIITAGNRGIVKTGVWIDRVDWTIVPDQMIPELQIRARSGLALKHGITLMNGVGTIDADYPDEIGVILFNSSTTDFRIEKGDRIAQIVLNLVLRIPGLEVGALRTGGFGSTQQR